jgi:hypothetical protein
MALQIKVSHGPHSGPWSRSGLCLNSDLETAFGAGPAQPQTIALGALRPCTSSPSLEPWLVCALQPIRSRRVHRWQLISVAIEIKFFCLREGRYRREAGRYYLHVLVHMFE